MLKKLSLITLFLVFAACAPELEKKPIDLVWPLPPDEPRIKYIDYIRGSIDIVKKKKFIETLFGEERIDIFIKPYGVTVDRSNRIYITDKGRVWVIDLEKGEYSFLGAEPGIGRVDNPVGVAASSDGRVFVADVSQDRVFVYKDGKAVALLGQQGEFKTPSSIAIDEKRRRIYVADSNSHVINVYNLDDYSKIMTIGRRGHEKGEFNFPTNIALNSEGLLHVVDTGNWRIQVFDPEGNLVRTFGQIGDVPGTFTRPKGIGIDSEDNIYVVDAAFENVQIFNKEGQLLMFFGGPGIEPGQLGLPAGLYIDHEDRIYVVEQLNKRFQIFQYMGKKWKEKQK
ncbi:MAG: 6-bladed beta-propeller [Thermodesulfovibrionales bacterium]|nr:6-bladed beta-propeller [Thermodesulfovibrionales bacterium]